MRAGQNMADRLAEAAAETYAPDLAELDRKIEEFFTEFETAALVRGTDHSAYFDFDERRVPTYLRQIASRRVEARARAEGLDVTRTYLYVRVLWEWRGGSV